MTLNPPFQLEGKTLKEVRSRGYDEHEQIPLAKEVDELQRGCTCTESDADPETTIIHSFDKWWLMQCKTCGGIFWRHNVQADYGDPRME